jgi:N-acetylmuramoyl-L-alanine amidase
MVRCVAWYARFAGGAGVLGILLSVSAVSAQTVLPTSVQPVPRPVATAVALPAAAAAAHQSTRFVVGLDRTVDFQVSSLPNPNRVIIDLPETRLSLPPPPAAGAKGLVTSFYGGLSGPGRMRIVIDVAEAVVVEAARIERSRDGRSHQLMIDIAPTAAVTSAPPAAAGRGKAATPPYTLGAAGVQPPLPRPAARPSEQAAKAFKQVIVIDPGHGGIDSGAIKYGTVEKDVVLAFSKALRQKLEASGRYRILMTRETDTFVELDARREFAERNKAALFIAVHADYASTGASGATIYSLREGVANELKRSAKGEVASNVLTQKELASLKQAQVSADVGIVQSILGDLAQREVETTKDRTGLFTRSVIEYMGASTSMRDNPDRTATFRVLKTAQVPAVLIELAYVSNAQDARNLKSDAWRDKVADSIRTAIDNYFSHQLARMPL